MLCPAEIAAHRVAEVVAQDLKVEDNKVTAYRTTVRVSFKLQD
ncbi:MAG: hypothetical protein CL388_07980 [Acidiferrobacteraceae bacterium]|nr:hypothetical protein [Acidiferrobacteraceae bacterium]